jgi:hypothetical protein
MSVWFQAVNSVSYGAVLMFLDATSSYGWSMLVRLGDFRVVYDVYGDTDQEVVSNISPMITGNWYHYVWASDGTTAQQYANGVADGSPATGWGATVHTATRLATGLAPDNVHYGLNPGGSIADVAVWTVRLTAAEIQALYYGIRPGAVRQRSLLVWWPLGTTQSPQPDLSGNGYNGTVSGTWQPVMGPQIAPITPRWPQGNILPITPAGAKMVTPQTVTIPYTMSVSESVAVTVHTP